MNAAAKPADFSRFSPFAKLYLGKTQIRFYIEKLGLSFAPHHVLLALGARADWRGGTLGESTVKLSTLQQISGYSRRAVQMALRDLEEMGEIETVKRVNRKGRQRCNGYRLVGLLRACGIMRREPEEPQEAPREAAPQSENESGTIAPLKPAFWAENCAPIPEDSSAESPYPQNESPKAQAEPKPRKARRAVSEEKMEEERQLEALAQEALRIHKEIAAPSWRRMLWDTRRARFWLARRILRIGGLQEWRKILTAARTSSWLRSKDFGLAFFTAPSVVAAIEAGAYGVGGEKKAQTQPSGPLQFTEERLKAEPWLKYASDLDAWLRDIPSGKLGDLKEEAAKLKKLFGKAAECYAVWRIRGDREGIRR